MGDKLPLSHVPLLGDAATPAKWPAAREHVEGASPTYWLATVRPDGSPHVRPVLAVWVDGGVNLCASERSRKAKNLALDSRWALTVEQSRRVCVGV
jgi:pyridoxine/pyridoxamine 5'-phosphate oxidase